MYVWEGGGISGTSGLRLGLIPTVVPSAGGEPNIQHPPSTLLPSPLIPAVALTAITRQVREIILCLFDSHLTFETDNGLLGGQTLSRTAAFQELPQ